jgi:hypothetical protein
MWYDTPPPKQDEAEEPKGTPSPSERTTSAADANRRAESASRPGGRQLGVFGSPPLLEGEDTKAYKELASRFGAVVQPADILEEMWVQDVVDHTWEVIRLRGLLASLIGANMHKGLRETLVPLVGPLQADTLAEAWAASPNPEVDEKIDKALASARLSMEAVRAQTYSLKLDDVERLDRLIGLAEARRNAALREIEWHREMLGQRLRRVVQQVEGGQLPVIESKPINGTDAK